MLRTKKTFRALAMITALVMALCLTSVVAFAEDATTVTLEAEVVDEAVGKISVEGTISVADADVTILALRDTAVITAETLGTMDDETLASKIVYINQEAAVEGAYAFSFIPKAGVPGGKVTVFVGGEGVDAPQSASLDVTPNGPALAVADADLVIGDDLVIALSGLEAEDETAWWAAVTSITVGDTTVDKAEVAYAAGSITISGLAAAEYEDITIAATDFNASVYEGTITVSLKDAPTAAATATEYVWGTDAIVVNLTGATEGWYDAVSIGASAGTVAIDEVENTITIAADDVGTQPAKDGETEVTISFTGAVEYKAVADVVVTVVSPLKAASESYTAIVENKKADVDLLTYTYTIPDNYTDENGVSVAYTTTGLEEATSAPGEGVTVYTVNRHAENEQTVTVTVTLTHSGYGDDSIEITKTYTVKIIGDDGVDITVTPDFGGDSETSAAIAEKATFVLTDAEGNEIELVLSDGSFAAEAVTEGEYTLTIARPGYITMDVVAEVTGDGLDFEMPEMIAGDVNGDDSITLADFNVLRGHFNAADAETAGSTAIASDFNGDNQVTLADFNMMRANFNYVHEG